MLASNANITPSSSGTPNRYKKPLLDVTNSSTPPSATQLITGLKSDPIKIPIASRLQALASNQSNKETQNSVQAKIITNNNNNKEKETITNQKLEVDQPVSTVQNHTTLPQATSFSGIQISSFVPLNKASSNQSTPNSVVSPLPIAEVSHSPNSKPGGGFQMTIGVTNVPVSNSDVKKDDDDSRHSFGSAPSPGMVTPQGKKL